MDASFDYESQLQAAQEALRREDWYTASNLLLEIYETTQTWEINHRLVTALYMDEQYQLAENYSFDFLEEYLATPEHFRLILQLALQNQQFIYARQLVEMVDEPVQQAEWREAIQKEETIAEQTMATTLKTVARQFYHMSDYGFNEQRQRYEAARRLPLDTFLTGARFLLVDPFTRPVIRASLLEDLQKLRIHEVIEYRWLDEELYEVVPVDMPPLVLHPIFDQVMQHTQQLLGQEDPIALDMVGQELRLQLALAYPQLERVITDVKAWVEATISAYYDTANHAETPQQAQWHEKIAQLTQSIFMNEDNS
jgi:hypothetical protein